MRKRRLVARIARDEAKKLDIPVVHVPELAFTAFFERYSCHDKYDVATVLAASFPELAWRVPGRPTFFDPEPRSILYFDSIALGIAYLDLSSEGEQKPIGEDGILSPASQVT